MQAALLDTRITIQQKVVARDPETNAQTWTWAEFASRWARVEESSSSGGEGGGESARGSVFTYARPTRVMLRWIDGITTAMRVLRVRDGRIFQIIGIAHTGQRKSETRLTCVDWAEENTP